MASYMIQMSLIRKKKNCSFKYYEYNLKYGYSTKEQLLEEGISCMPGIHPCNQIAVGLYLTSNGNVIRCPGDSGKPLGNVQEESIASIWNKHKDWQYKAHFNCHCPYKDGITPFYEPMTAAAQGDELHSLVVEFGEMPIGGELRVEDQGGVQSSTHLLPEGQESKDLFIGLISMNVGCRIQDELAGGILGEQGKSTLHSLASGSCPVLLQHRLVSKVGNRVEIEIDDTASII
jgi:hypothetical protein